MKVFMLGWEFPPFISGGLGTACYGHDMYDEVHHHVALVAELAENKHFDIVHAHDWMTFPAGSAVSAIAGKPLVVHVHSTEFDRRGEHVNRIIYDIEREGMERADRVIAISHFTRNIIVGRYSVVGDKVEVVYKSVERNGSCASGSTDIKKDEKIVLFLGRITTPKGPEYSLKVLRRSCK